MGSKIDHVVQKMGKVVQHEAQELKDAARQIGKALQQGEGVGPAIRAAGNELRDTFLDLGGSAVGFAGMFGFRYGVKDYLFRVSPGLARGSRLDGDLAPLKADGFRAVVNLCAENDVDAAPAREAGMNHLRVPIFDNTAPTQAQMKGFLDFVTLPENQPAYVHCQAGKGRTGVAVACYRMAVEGWPLEKALAEAKDFGLAIPEQIDFLEGFARDLAAGAIAGYPRK